MPKKSSLYCLACDYCTDHKTKYDRHVQTQKHKIATRGIQCCGLYYYNKHQWINHKKSKKHRSMKLNENRFKLRDCHSPDSFSGADCDDASCESAPSYLETASDGEKKNLNLRKKRKINLTRVSMN